MLTSPPFEHATVGICIVDVKTEKEIYSLNPHQFFIPASLQKIIVSAVTLEELQDEIPFKTRLEIDGTIEEGILKGDVWLIGGGDPTLTLNAIDAWETALLSKGIKKIDGNLFVDSSFFESSLASPYWLWEDVGNYFGVGASGLSIHENYYSITFKPGKIEGEEATIIKIEPRVPHLHFHNAVKTGPKGSGDKVFVFGSEYSSLQFYRGTVPIDCETLTVKAALPDPAFLCGAFLAEKIPVTKKIICVRDKQEPKNRICLLETASPPLKEILYHMNQVSHNLYAEHLFKRLGNGNSFQAARHIEAFLKKRNIPSQIRDGAGLARNNLITPHGLVALLVEMRKKNYLSSTFPTIGVGTLSSFPPLQNIKMCAKTGSMQGIYNLGGYLTLATGDELAFAIFCNHFQGDATLIQKEIAQFISEFFAPSKSS